MRIQIKAEGHNFRLALPTRLVLNPSLVRLGIRMAQKYGDVSVPPETADVLVKELRRIKKAHGSWELVEVCSADGEIVKITL